MVKRMYRRRNRTLYATTYMTSGSQSIAIYKTITSRLSIAGYSLPVPTPRILPIIPYVQRTNAYTQAGCNQSTQFYTHTSYSIQIRLQIRHMHQALTEGIAKWGRVFRPTRVLNVCLLWHVKKGMSSPVSSLLFWNVIGVVMAM
jgi:hypothetical protein